MPANLPDPLFIFTTSYEVEVFFLHRLPAVTITGDVRGGPAVLRELTELARSAVESAKVEWPRVRMAVSVKALPKPYGRAANTSELPLAMALAACVFSGALDRNVLDLVSLHAAVSLNGDLRPLSGLVEGSRVAQARGRAIVAPAIQEGILDQAARASWFAGATLADLLALWKQPNATAKKSKGTHWPEPEPAASPVGPYVSPGTCVFVSGDEDGAVRFAQRAAEALGPMTVQERFDSAEIRDLLGLPLPADWSDLKRPLRAPHHTIGAAPLREEALLAKHGVLLLDQADLFRATTREALVDLPMQDVVTIAAVGAGADKALFRALRPSVILPAGSLA